MVEDMTRLFTRIYQGTSADGSLFGSGHPPFPDAEPAFHAGVLRGYEHPSLIARLKAMSQFFSFCYGELRDTYLSKYSPIYHTEYENLVFGENFPPRAEESGTSFSSPAFTTRISRGETDEVFWDVALIRRER